MIVLFTFEYGTNLTEHESDLLTPLVRKSGGGMREEKLPFVTEERPHVWFHGEYSGDLEQLAKAVPRIVPLLKLVEIDIAPTAWQAIIERLNRIEEKIGKVGPADQGFNQKVNVQVPGLGLLLIDECYVETDACSDHIGRLLGQNWRILAICPQPDQRRPDYVMGRTKPKDN